VSGTGAAITLANGDSITASSGTITLVSGAAATVTGTSGTVNAASGNTVSFGTNSSATVNGSGVTINGASGDRITLAANASDTVSGSGATIKAVSTGTLTLAANASDTICGSGAENAQRQGAAERQIDDFSQKEAKTAAKLGDMTIASPIGGIVLGLSVTTLGQVVNPSEETMRAVPDGTEIEAYVENKDVGFVEPGQAATVKTESFPFTRYGVLDATVIRVAHDAIPEPGAQTAEGNPAKTTKQSYFGGAQRTQNLVFPVTLSLRKTSMDIDGAQIPLRPGMTAPVEVKTGKRRILEYLFSPLVQTVSSAMRER
jgi:HlyD family type I secretion membrane fusion protein